MLRSFAGFCRNLLPQPVRRFAGQLGRFFGTPWPNIDDAMLRLHKRGFRPRFAVDVGAYHGSWTKLFKSIFPEAAVVMVEAQESKRPFLQELVDHYGKTVELQMALLGATGGQTVRFVEMETGSSVYEEQSPYPRQVKEMVTAALDDLLGARATTVDFLKLDVQGYELEVLRGAPKALRSAQCVLLEGSLVPTNRGTPLISEVVRFMDDAGFRMYDLCGLSRRGDGVLWQTDLLFIRNDSSLVPSAELNASNWE